MDNLEQLLKGKTPVSVLQEICSKKKLTPDYNILANEGPVHEPVFVMRAQAGDFQGTGKGPSKKKAKHNAASQLLCSMHGIKCQDVDETVENSGTANGELGLVKNGSLTEDFHSSGTLDGDMQGNPIGELQEYTQKNLLRPPQYQFINEQGPPHAREFVCTVKLAKLQETAVGKSKKIAKRAAASKLLQAVQQLQNENTSAAILDDDEDELPLPMNAQLSERRGKNISSMNANGAKSAQEFYEKLKITNGGGPTLQTLHQSSLSAGDNFCKMLEDLAKEKKFEVRYLDIKEKSYSGQYQCLVQITMPPIAVCLGTGLTAEDARTCAAHNALQYLKIVTLES